MIRLMLLKPFSQLLRVKAPLLHHAHVCTARRKTRVSTEKIASAKEGIDEGLKIWDPAKDPLAEVRGLALHVAEQQDSTCKIVTFVLTLRCTDMP